MASFVAVPKTKNNFYARESKGGFGKMHHFPRTGRIAAITLAAAVSLWTGGAGIFGLQSARAQAPGPEVCAGCHEKEVNYYNNSVHGQKGNLRGPANAGECSTCHGDATEHVKAGGGRGVGGIKNPGGSSASMSADDKNHDLPDLPRGRQQAHALGRQHAPGARQLLHELPHHAHARQGPDQAHAARSLLHLPQAAAHRRATARSGTRSSKARWPAPTATTRTARSAAR